MNVLELIQKKGLEPRLKRTGGKRGEEWCSPCPRPGCSQNDGFLIFPEQNNGEGSWYCRNCPPGRNGGDAIAFLMYIDGLAYKEACAVLGKAPGDLPPAPVTPQRSRKHTPKPHRPSVYQSPKDQWREHAAKFATYCHEQLLANHPDQIALLAERGITCPTIQRWSLGWNYGQNGNKDAFRAREAWGLDTITKPSGQKKKLWLPRGLVIPYYRNDSIERLRIRRPAEHLRNEKDPRYYVIEGSGATTWLIGEKRRAYVIVETELDGLLIDQEAGDLVGVIALGSSAVMPDDHCHAHLKDALVILNALDFDKAGAKAWNKWPRAYPRAERWPVPDGKDPGEAYQRGVSIRKWILAGLPPAWHVGPSRFIGAASKGTTTATRPQVTEPQPQATKPSADPITELASLLRRHPVTIVSTTHRTTMQYPSTWKNEAAGKRISELIYFNPECRHYIADHPAETITGRNFLNPNPKEATP